MVFSFPAPSAKRTGVALLFATTCAGADDFTDAREQFKHALKASNISAVYAGMINFESEPDVSSSTLKIDSGLLEDDEINLTKLPLRHEFDLTHQGWKPFVQATLGKFKYTQKASLLDDPNETLDSRWKSYSATIGGGVRIPLGHGFSILPAIDGGYASLKNDGDYAGPISTGLLQPLLDGILTNWSADAWLANGHLALKYEGAVGKFDVDAKASYTYSHIESYRTSDPVLDFSENMGTVSFKLDATYPLNASLGGYPLGLIGHIGNSSFVGPNRDTLGFDSVYEVGLSLEVDISQHDLPVKKLSLGGEYLWGDDVRGWSILFNYRF